MRIFRSSWLSLCCLLGIVLLSSHGLVHRLAIKADDRDIFKIETFGFVGGGTINITVTDFALWDKKRDDETKIGFIMRKARTESAAQQDLEKTIEKGQCILGTRISNLLPLLVSSHNLSSNLISDTFSLLMDLDNLEEDDFVVDLSDQSSWLETTAGHTVSLSAPGLYSLIFARCLPAGNRKVDFHLDAQFRNPGPNFLSAGDAPLPLLYFIFFLLFSVAFVLWCWVLSRDEATNGTVHRVHYMMAILLALKCLTLLSESVRYHYISIVGAAMSEGWSIVYYVFAFFKGVMLFTVILLIGSGWSLMKSYLNDREKKIILIVLSLQVLDNIAMVVLEETAQGSQGWLTWRDFLHLVDIVCCCAILFPIVWSIRHLRQAAEADGKAQHNLVKLQLFRQFYVMVSCYGWDVCCRKY